MASVFIYLFLIFVLLLEYHGSAGIWCIYMISSVQGAVLSGGKGTRFWPFNGLIPKPLVPVGEAEKPLLEYIVAWLSQNGINRIALLVGHKYKQVVNYFGTGSRWNVELVYSVDDEYEISKNDIGTLKCGVHMYCDTGGALLKAIRTGKITSDTILVWYGDIISDLDVKALLEKHFSSKAVATIAVADKYKVPVGIPRLDGDNVVEMREKPWLENVKPSIGILAVEKEAVEEAGESIGKSFDIMRDLIPRIIRNGGTVKAYIHSGHWYDVGSIERYRKIPEEIFETLRKMLGRYALLPV